MSTQFGWTRNLLAKNKCLSLWACINRTSHGKRTDQHSPNLTCMFLDYVRKTSTCTRRTCKLHIESLSVVESSHEHFCCDLKVLTTKPRWGPLVCSREQSKQTHSPLTPLQKQKKKVLSHDLGDQLKVIPHCGAVKKSQ